MSAIKFTGIDAEYKGTKVNVPIPVFDATLQYSDKETGLSMLLDTGSNGTMLYPHCIKLLSPDFIPETQEPGVEVTIKQFGDLSINRAKKMRLDLGSLPPEPIQTPMVSGIVGSDFLKDYALHIDFAKSEFLLLKEKPEQLPFSCKFTIDEDKRFLCLYPQVLGVELKLIYDTGCGGALVLFEPGFAKVPQEPFKATGREYAEGAFGATYYYDSYEETEMELSFCDELKFKTEFGVMQQHSMIDEASAHYDGLLGNQLFAGRQVVIDYVSQTFSFS